MVLTFDSLPSQPPKDALERLLAPLRLLAPEDHEEPPDPDLLPNDLLLAWWPDGSPTWWPLNRDANGKNWTLAERRAVLAKHLQQSLPADVSGLLKTKNGAQQILDTLRRIAYEASLRVPGIQS